MRKDYDFIAVDPGEQIPAHVLQAREELMRTGDCQTVDWREVKECYPIDLPGTDKTRPVYTYEVVRVREYICPTEVGPDGFYPSGWHDRGYAIAGRPYYPSPGPFMARVMFIIGH